jgi:hypothetical protein
MKPKITLGMLPVLLSFPVLLVLMALAWGETKSEWFQSLQDARGRSCCDQSDCKPTNARFIDGRWEAEFAGAFTPVPDAKILDKESYDGRAYLCALPDQPGKPTIYCFVKPGGQS